MHHDWYRHIANPADVAVLQPIEEPIVTPGRVLLPVSVLVVPLSVPVPDATADRSK